MNKETDLATLRQSLSDSQAEISKLLAERACEHSHIHALAGVLNGDTPLPLPEMVERALEMRAQITRLKAAIENAPHDTNCNLGITHQNKPFGCTCWKAQALNAERKNS